MCCKTATCQGAVEWPLQDNASSINSVDSHGPAKECEGIINFLKGFLTDGVTDKSVDMPRLVKVRERWRLTVRQRECV